jgi:hypothetical protein
MPEFIADLLASLLVEVLVELIASAAVDGGGLMGDLLTAFARISCPQFVETFEVVLT